MAPSLLQTGGDWRCCTRHHSQVSACTSVKYCEIVLYKTYMIIPTLTTMQNTFWCTLHSTIVEETGLAAQHITLRLQYPSLGANPFSEYY